MHADTAELQIVFLQSSPAGEAEAGAEATWETSNPIATRRSVTLVVMAGVADVKGVTPCFG
jgi:hypothetical protein